jgi:mannose-1-phosphate guanylyltransferase/mannose-6-phosphate isomerase
MLPKQFIEFPGMQGSLFQNTLRRLEGVDEIGEPIIVCNADHRFLVAEQLRQLGKGHCNILLEPVSRNTAPAVSLAALLSQQDNADPLLLVLPADHIIQNQHTLQRAIADGRQLARQQQLITFGIEPGTPETGYGYIEKGDLQEGGGSYCVNRFVEKPDLETAKTYLKTGNYLWNSGMFLFSASSFLKELKKHAPDIFESCHEAYRDMERGADFQLIPESIFVSCRSDSIDYAVMEKTDTATVIPLDAGWNDLGAWDALWETRAKSAQSNVVAGDVIIENVSNSYIESQSRLVAVAGLKDVVVVETADAVLVVDKKKVQSVKHLVEQLQEQDRDERAHHRLVHRPWGSYESLCCREGYQVKHIVVNAGASLSLQLHHKRSEHWTVIRGVVLVTCDDKELELRENESAFIPLGSKHRLTNNSESSVEIIEVQIGEYLGEDDIVRFEDCYDRV